MSESSAGDPSEAAGLAPRWHTALLVSLILAVVISGTLLAPSAARASTAPSGSRVTELYLPMLLSQWGLAFYVCRIGRSRSALRELLGTGWNGPARAFGDLALACLGWGLVQGGELLAAAAFGLSHASARASLLPASPVEQAVWVLVAVSVGFCEELVYRGYLLAQLGAFSGSIVAGSLLQAALFGLAHGEQGAGIALRFGAYGLLFAALAGFRRSLVPSILSHIALDLSAAFFH